MTFLIEKTVYADLLNQFTLLAIMKWRLPNISKPTNIFRIGWKAGVDHIERFTQPVVEKLPLSLYFPKYRSQTTLVSTFVFESYVII